MERTYYSLIVLLFCLCDISLIEGFGFSVDIIHRDYPVSPFYIPNETDYKRVAKAIHRSINYANRFNKPFSTKNVESKVLPNNGEYLMTYSIGTPPVKILGIVDTGSDVLWLQCQPCYPRNLSVDTLTLSSTSGSTVLFPKTIIGCGNNNTLVFEGKGSGIVGLGNGPVSLITQLGSSVQGKFSYCLGPTFTGTKTSSKLKFGDDAVVSGDGVVSTPMSSENIGYGDESRSQENLSVDTLTLSSTSGSAVSFPKTVIGFGNTNTLDFDGEGYGIVGHGNGPVSLITQLGSSVYGKFSYCLVTRYAGTKASSKLKFGDDVVVSGDGVVSTPMSPEKVFYYLTIEAFSVGNKRVEFGSSSTRDNGCGNIIIDSGTTLTLLPKDVYSNLESALTEAIHLKRVESPSKSLSLCYNFPSSDQDLPVKIITVHFTGGDVQLKALNTFIQVNDSVICFAFRPTTQSFNIFGNLAQQNLLVGYDIQKKTLSMKLYDCTMQ
ncbi:putative nepenthesin [Lupinus albus]|uniref:Putative nepenthesin n=1 Tax=Lupinus albus TaxID=3870 RepID=A0A6A4R4B3_LUPAL|nr:putative nepenthesin [Lupinus albus]